MSAEWENMADKGGEAAKNAASSASGSSIAGQAVGTIRKLAGSAPDRLMADKPDVSTDELQDRLGCSEPAAHGVRFCLGLLGGPDVGNVTDTVAEDGFAAAFKLAKERVGGGGDG